MPTVDCPDVALISQGISALKRQLGEIGMERFIMLMNRGKWDYTQWRADLMEDQSIEKIAEEADSFARSLDQNQ